MIVVNGDAPLISPESLRALVDGHERSGAAATIATMVLDDPTGYGRVVRAPDGTVERVVETKAPGDATELELHIREVNTGMFAFEGAALPTALAGGPGRQRPGRALPARRAADPARATSGRWAPTSSSDPDELLGINDRRQLADGHRRSPSAGSTSVTCSPA